MLVGYIEKKINQDIRIGSATEGEGGSDWGSLTEKGTLEQVGEARSCLFPA